MNGDELVDVDFAALLERHRATGAAATVTVARPPSSFGQVDVTDDDVITGFHEVSVVPYWVNCGIYVLGDEALARFPEKGDHETTTFPGARRRGEAARLPARRPVAHREHAEGAASEPTTTSPPTRSGSRERARARAHRAAAGRQAVGLGARVGRDRRLRRQAPVRAPPGSRSASSTTR